MRLTRFRVYFDSNRIVIVWALTENEAKILAQAEEIRHGNSYNVISVSKF